MTIIPLNVSSSTYSHLRRFDDLINPFIGPIYGAFQHSGLDDSGLNGWITTVRALNSNIVSDFLTKSNSLDFAPPTGRDRRSGFIPAGGKGLHGPSDALVGGIGEFVERYLACLAFFRDLMRERIQYASSDHWEQEGRDHLAPDRIHLFAPEQYKLPAFPFRPFTRKTVIGWVEGTTLRGAPILVPAQLVYMLHHRRKEEEVIAYPTSGGLSFRPTRDEAIFHGILELLERDAVNLFWVSRIPASRMKLNLADLGFRSQHLHGGDLLVLSMRTDVEGLNVVHANYFNKTARVFLGGGGADFDRVVAVQKALMEIKQTGSAIRRIDMTCESMTKEDLVDFFYIIPYYSNPARMYDLKRKIECQLSRQVEECVGSRLADITLTELTKRLDCEPIIVDLDAQGLGVKTGSLIRVLLPSYTSAGVPKWPFMGHPRFYSTPRQWGIRADQLEFATLNRDPLPFP